MYHAKFDLAVGFEADCNWDDMLTGEMFYKFECEALEEVYKTGAESLEAFCKRWGIIKLYTLDRSLCSAGYIDRLHPEKSWSGQNPETLRKIAEYMKCLDSEK